jgi:phosphoglycolate phosphatase-like HAD superfamily hydrolase
VIVLTAFDLDGTLVDQVSAARAWTQEFVEKWNLPDDAVAVGAVASSARRAVTTVEAPDAASVCRYLFNRTCGGTTRGRLWWRSCALGSKRN